MPIHSFCFGQQRGHHKIKKHCIRANSLWVKSYPIPTLGTMDGCVAVCLSVQCINNKTLDNKPQDRKQQEVNWTKQHSYLSFNNIFSLDQNLKHRTCQHQLQQQIPWTSSLRPSIYFSPWRMISPLILMTGSNIIWRGPNKWWRAY